MQVRGYTAARFPARASLHDVPIAGDLSAEVEDWWADFARSLRRRNRSDATVEMYREAFCAPRGSGPLLLMRTNEP
jgi:hypothetical protein